MKYKIIKTESQYKDYLSRIDELMDAEANTIECDELELLGLIVCDYEEKNFELPLPEQKDIDNYLREQRGINVDFDLDR